MRRITLVLLLVLVCIFAASAALSAASLSTAEWPKSRHDVRNSGCSPATSVAIPSIDWIADTSTTGVTGVTTSYGTWSGPIFDSNNIYAWDVGSAANGDLFCYTRNGVFNWVARKPDNTSVMEFAWDYATYGDVALWNDGTVDRVVTEPGGTKASNSVFFYDIATGLLNGTDVNVNPAAAALMSSDAPTIGPDGTIYTFNGPYTGSSRTAVGYSGGTLYAIDGVTRQIKWSWGANGTVAGGKSLGSHWGSMALRTINGKTVIYIAMARDKANDYVGTTNATFAGPWAGKSLFAIEDDGNTCSVLWSADPAYSEWCPALSNDNNTLYIACEEKWVGDANYKNSSGKPLTLYAYDAVTGAKKWAIYTGAEHFSQPAIGKDGSLYLVAGYWQTGSATTRIDPGGKLFAFEDKGTTAALKWSIGYDYESNSYFSSPVVTSSNPPVVYFGSTSGRLFAVQDNGYSCSQLWTFPRIGAGVVQWPTPVIADNGQVICHWNKYIIAFKSGYDGSPIGINGYVKNMSGDPIPNAWVVAATTTTPMMGNATKYFVHTDSKGYYSISVPAGTWYVEAWLPGRLVGTTQSVVMPSDTSSATLNDFVLPMGGPNLCVNTGAVASTTDPAPTNSPARAIDGNRTTAFAIKQVPSPTAPVSFIVDLGSNKTIGEVTIKWATWAIDYQLQALADNGTVIDPKVDANWATATTLATGVGAIGGVPSVWDQYGSINEHIEVVHFQPLSARWWRIRATNNKIFSINEFELRDGEPAGPESGKCGDVRSMVNGVNVLLEGKQITAINDGGYTGITDGGIPADVAYIEDTERSSAIRIHVTGLAAKKVGTGDKVDIFGKVATDATTGEKYVEVTAINKLASPRPLDALVMNSKSANDAKSKGLFVKLVGKVEAGTGGASFILNDGGKPVKVYCGTIAIPTSTTAKVRGILSTDGANATLLVDNMLDIADAAATSQALPFPSAAKYIRDCIIAGPFTDPAAGGTDNQTKADALMAIDFIARANPDGSVFEYNVQPAIGDPVGSGVPGMTWKRYDGVDDKINFNTFFNNGTQNTFSVAYAVLYVYSPVAQNVDLTLGSDDELQVWANGNSTSVFLDQGLRGCNYSQFGQVNSNRGIDLNQGMNTLVFKVVNGAVDFGLCANIIEPGTWDSALGAVWGNGLGRPDIGYYISKP